MFRYTLLWVSWVSDVRWLIPHSTDVSTLRIALCPVVVLWLLDAKLFSIKTACHR